MNRARICLLSTKKTFINANKQAGLIQTEDDEYFIEPIEEQHDSASPQRHVIYKRSSIRQSVIMGKRKCRYCITQ